VGILLGVERAPVLGEQAQGGMGPNRFNRRRERHRMTLTADQHWIAAKIDTRMQKLIRAGNGKRI
jgi:hypothetical protein